GDRGEVLPTSWTCEPKLHSHNFSTCFPRRSSTSITVPLNGNLLRNCCEIRICSRYTRAEPTGLEPLRNNRPARGASGEGPRVKPCATWDAARVGRLFENGLASECRAPV